MRLQSLSEGQDRPEDIERLKQEYSLLHGELKIPMEFRRYWSDPKELIALGVKPPAFVKHRGYDNRSVSLPDPKAMSSVQTGPLGLGYIIGQSGRQIGWLYILGKDQSGRRAWVVAIPPPDSMKYKAGLDRALGTAPDAQKMPGPAEIAAARKAQGEHDEARKKAASVGRAPTKSERGLIRRIFGI